MSLYHRTSIKDGTPIRSKYWSYKFNFRGEQFPRATRFTDKQEAKRLMEKHRLALERDWAEHGAISSETDHRYRRREVGEASAVVIRTATTIADICAAITNPKAPLEASLKTRIANAKALVNVLRRVNGEGVENLPVTAFNAAFIEKFFLDATTRANAALTQILAARVKLTAASTLSQACQVFGLAAMRYFRSVRLDLPDMKSVANAIKECRFNRGPKTEYIPAPESVIQATLEAWEQLDERDIFLAVGHALAFGMRRGEIGQARWDWHVEQGGQPYVITAGAKVKDRTGRLTIRGLDPFYTTMMSKAARRGWRGAAEDYILTGSESFRTKVIFQNVNKWMRGLGWKTTKAIHALRAYSGSQVAMMADLYTASKWLRHKQYNVTEKSYSGFVNQFAHFNRDLLKVRWAKLAPASSLVSQLVSSEPSENVNIAK